MASNRVGEKDMAMEVASDTMNSIRLVASLTMESAMDLDAPRMGSGGVVVVVGDDASRLEGIPNSGGDFSVVGLESGSVEEDVVIVVGRLLLLVVVLLVVLLLLLLLPPPIIMDF